MGVNAHFGAPVMHTGRPAHPRARQRLAASPRGRPWRRSRFGRGGERPQGHRCPVRARGRARFHTLVPAPSGVAPLELIPAGRLVQPLLRGGGAPGLRPAGRRAVRHRRAGPGRVRHGSRWPSRTGLLDRERPSGEGVRDVHIPTLRDARTGHRNTRVAPDHGPETRIGTGDPGAVAQPQAVQRLAEPSIRTPMRHFPAQAPRWRFHTSGSATAMPIRVRRTVSRAAVKRGTGTTAGAWRWT